MDVKKNQRKRNWQPADHTSVEKAVPKGPRKGNGIMGKNDQIVSGPDRASGIETKRRRYKFDQFNP